MRIKNVLLKSKIFEKGLTQKAIAQETGISEAYLSMLINGKYIPTEFEKKNIADFLGYKQEELFQANSEMLK